MAQFGHIKAVVQPSRPAPLTKVHVTTKETVIDPVTGDVTFRQSVDVIDTRVELEACILTRNHKHFAQPERTPFTDFPMKTIRPDTLYQYFEAAGAPLNLPTGVFQETIESTVSFDDFCHVLSSLG
jgi:hypothetical protein